MIVDNEVGWKNEEDECGGGATAAKNILIISKHGGIALRS